MKRKNELIQKIKSDLGINISDYSNGDFVSKITDVIFIQKYAISKLIIPLGVVILGYILGFFILDLGVVGYPIYGFLGLVSFIILGICCSVFSIFNQLKNDIVEILNLAISPLKLAVRDLLKNTEKIASQKNPLTLVFEGIIFVNITPVIFSVFDKVPFLGKFLLGGSEKILGMAVNSFKKQEDKMNLKTDKLTNVISKFENIDSFTERFRNTIDKVLSKGIRIVKFPFKITFVIALIILIIIILSYI